MKFIFRLFEGHGPQIILPSIVIDILRCAIYNINILIDRIITNLTLVIHANEFYAQKKTGIELLF